MENNQRAPMDHEFPSASERAAASGAGGDVDQPGRTPPETQPGEGGDTDNPGRRAPEQQPGQGDFDQPGATPPEIPGQPVDPARVPPPD